MSILIKGMELPKENDYKIAIVYGDGVVTEYHEDYWIRGADGEKQLGTAVPVSPHGRLIDADALRYWSDDSAMIAFDYVTRSQINDAPTIIQADPAEEGE